MAHSIRTRLGGSLVANVLRSGIGFSTGLLIARWLGPQDYGRMAFLLASLIAFRPLLDMASSQAFFTFLSQRPRSRRFVGLYWRWIALQFFGSVLVIGLLLPDAWINELWKGEERSLVLLACIAAFMQGVVWPVASQMAEAQRETIRVQRLSALVTLFHLGVAFALWWIGRLAVPLLFAAMALEWGVAGWRAARLYRGHAELTEADHGAAETVGAIWAEFSRYCLPFVPYAGLGFVAQFADRWLLQHWGGALEQAYYAVALQFAAGSLLATSSIVQIFWKEIAEAHYRKDHARLERLYRIVSRSTYFVGAVVAGGSMPWASEIIRLTLGPAYLGGEVTLVLMILFSIHQSMGQIAGTMLIATSHTRTYVALGLFNMAASLVIAYFVMAPVDAVVPGFGLASRGLAYKMVLLQVVLANLQVWFISRIFGWKYDWGYQVAGLAMAVGGGWLAKALVLGVAGGPMLLLIILDGLVYLALIVGALYLLPWVAGVDRALLLGFAARLASGKER